MFGSELPALHHEHEGEPSHQTLADESASSEDIYRHSEDHGVPPSTPPAEVDHQDLEQQQQQQQQQHEPQHHDFKQEEQQNEDVLDSREHEQEQQQQHEQEYRDMKMYQQQQQQQEKLQQEQQQEQLWQEQLRQEQEQQEQERKEQLQQEQLRQEELRQEELRQEQLRQEQLRQEQLRQEQLRQEQLRQEQLKQEQQRQEQLRQEQLRQEQLRQEQLRQEQQRQEQLRQEQLRREEQQRQEQLRQEQQKQEQLWQEQQMQQQIEDVQYNGGKHVSLEPAELEEEPDMDDYQKHIHQPQHSPLATHEWSMEGVPEDVQKWREQQRPREGVVQSSPEAGLPTLQASEIDPQQVTEQPTGEREPFPHTGDVLGSEKLPGVENSADSTTEHLLSTQDMSTMHSGTEPAITTDHEQVHPSESSSAVPTPPPSQQTSTHDDTSDGTADGDLRHVTLRSGEEALVHLNGDGMADVLLPSGRSMPVDYDYLLDLDIDLPQVDYDDHYYDYEPPSTLNDVEEADSNEERDRYEEEEEEEEEEEVKEEEKEEVGEEVGEREAGRSEQEEDHEVERQKEEEGMQADLTGRVIKDKENLSSTGKQEDQSDIPYREHIPTQLPTQPPSIQNQPMEKERERIASGRGYLDVNSLRQRYQQSRDSVQPGATDVDIASSTEPDGSHIAEENTLLYPDGLVEDVPISEGSDVHTTFEQPSDEEGVSDVKDSQPPPNLTSITPLSQDEFVSPPTVSESDFSQAEIPHEEPTETSNFGFGADDEPPPPPFQPPVDTQPVQPLGMCVLQK